MAPKTCNAWRDFVQLQTSIANISGTDEAIQNREKPCDRQRFLPRSAKESPVNFGPLTTQA